jgi:glycosylphosphatidylinositol deacylase
MRLKANALVDLNEEFSAFHGPTLRQQAAYVSAAIEHIRSLYPTAPAVILLGHSMGGIVARLAAIASPHSSVSVILTMATPHTISPAPLDYTVEAIYHTIAAHQLSRPIPLLVSICGGISDTQVVSDTCALGPPELHPDDGFTVFSTGIPGAWTPVDHQAMVWCHQIRWAVARVLLETAGIQSRTGRLGRMKRWLTDERADRSVSAGGGEKHRVQVTGKAMSVLVRWARSDIPLVTHCRPGTACVAVEGNISRLPWVQDEGKPFPLVGEGVKAEDVVTAIDLQLDSADGYLEVAGQQVLETGVYVASVKADCPAWRAGESSSGES